MHRLGLVLSVVGVLYVLVDAALPALGWRLVELDVLDPWGSVVAIVLMLTGGVLEVLGRHRHRTSANPPG